ncbi:substrate-binding domain-containing protein [Pontibacter sp. 172403-2]|uniref:LacI family DNA-binding transcriptional regulator n=1 Tax=Pontibacter rufus TaxID=2791028 RepID=UPI0018AFC4AD|nr:substrate-binding domain-containing protein [Pontibacter sp. 172403-2]MBF9255722.1 substrate-binding domain-containing protein [Pontibacter sp. 172403-2]
MRNKVSLKDIAQKVGVSTAAVSYALSTGKEGKVSEEVANRIKAAAKELNYQPNQIAKSLKMGRTNTLGLIIADVSNPFFATIARVVEDEANKHGYTVIFGSSDECPERAWDLINVLLNRQVDGLIIVPSEASEEQILYLKDQKVPFVLIDRYFPEISSSFVAINNYKAAYDAVMHLAKAGRKRIGMLAYKTSLFHMQERKRGYQEALRDSGLSPDENWLKEVRHGDIKNEVKTAVEEMLASDDAIDALFFATNTLAINGLKYIDSLKLKVPDDLAIVSFDEGEAFDFYYCPLTFVRQPVVELGNKSVQLLLAQMSGSDGGISQVHLDPELVIRKSSGLV